jgi:two-component system sensor histidine kinase/response regulator
VALTADAYDEDVKRCLAAGMNGHIAKPFNPPLLFETLTRMLAGKSSQPGGPHEAD